MADALRVRCTEHSYEDVVLLHEAAKIRLPQEKGLIEANALRSYFSEALDLVRQPNLFPSRLERRALY